VECRPFWRTSQTELHGHRPGGATPFGNAAARMASKPLSPRLGSARAPTRASTAAQLSVRHRADTSTGLPPPTLPAIAFLDLSRLAPFVRVIR
jgi:hypothetical protein